MGQKDQELRVQEVHPNTKNGVSLSSNMYAINYHIMIGHNLHDLCMFFLVVSCG